MVALIKICFFSISLWLSHRSLKVLSCYSGGMQTLSLLSRIPSHYCQIVSGIPEVIDDLGHFMQSLGPSMEGELVDGTVDGISFNDTFYDV